MKNTIIFDMNSTLDNDSEMEINIISEIIKNKNPMKIYVELVRNDLKHPDWDYKEIVEKTFEKYVEDPQKSAEFFIKNKKVRVRKFFVDFINENFKKYRFFVVSKENEELVKAKLKEADLLDKFEGVFRIQKPSVEGLEKILLKNNIKPSECTFVGDDPLLDLLPAKALGMKTVLVNSFVDETWKIEK